MAERKPPRRTRERILATALRLFNEQGERRTTTAGIAAEMGISPGNLYYHFRDKRTLIAALFADYEERLRRLLVLPADRGADIEDLWLVLHLLFEAMMDYSFLYRDLDPILAQDDRLAMRFSRLVQALVRTIEAMCTSMVGAGTMAAARDEIATLARNVSVVATFWMPWQKTSSHGRGVERPVDPGQGIYQVLAMIAPFMRGDGRTLIERLSAEYR